MTGKHHVIRAMQLVALSGSVVLAAGCMGTGTPEDDESAANVAQPSKATTSTESTATTAGTTSASPGSYGALAEEEVREYSLSVTPMPDLRDYVEWVDTFEILGSRHVAFGRRLDIPGALGIVFSCVPPGTEDWTMVVASVPDDDPETITSVVEAYAEQAECEPRGAPPPVSCKDDANDPASCQEGEGDGG